MSTTEVSVPSPETNLPLVDNPSPTRILGLTDELVVPGFRILWPGDSITWGTGSWPPETVRSGLTVNQY